MFNRRKLLRYAAASASAAVLPKFFFGSEEAQATTSVADNSGFVFSLNMATIRGHKLGFIDELKTAAKAGFRSVEIWMDSFQDYLDKGGRVSDAKNIINDLGLTIENCIGFAEWIVDDKTRREKAIEQLKREMDLLAGISCRRTAAPPMGATDGPLLDLKVIAERYRTILEIGEQKNVVPQLELWGFSNNLKHMSEVMYVAMETGHPSAKVLLDVYHIFKGGSSVDTMHFIDTSGIEVFHINDYPSNISAADITDADRIYPGDGIAPLKRILPLVKKENKPLVLSFEVFNPAYYKQDALLVAQTALKKMKAVTTGIGGE